MIADINKLYTKNLEKITKAVNDSNFSLCTHLSSEMIRISDYVDFPDGVFISEYLESLFGNINFIDENFIIEEAIMNDLKKDINDLISILRASFPLDDKKKVNLYDLITKIRMKTTRLQLESFRGENKKKKQSLLGASMKRINKLPDLIEDLE